MAGRGVPSSSVAKEEDLKENPSISASKTATTMNQTLRDVQELEESMQC